MKLRLYPVLLVFFVVRIGEFFFSLSLSSFLLSSLLPALILIVPELEICFLTRSRVL